MPDIGTKLRNTSFKELFSVRARLVVLALILVVPFMADRVRVLESSRASQARAASPGANARPDRAIARWPVTRAPLRARRRARAAARAGG